MKKIFPPLLATICLNIHFVGFAQVHQASQERQDIIPNCLIGNQVYMVQNLAVKVFRNGDSIMFVSSDKEWFEVQRDHIPAWRYYNDDSTTIEKFGLMYNWFAVNDKRGLAPVGWHVPTKQEFEMLIAEIGANANALKSKSGWEKDDNGNNSSNFNAFPCGWVKSTGKPAGQEWCAMFWTQTIEKEYYPTCLQIFTKEDKLFIVKELSGSGLSVRCIQNQ